MPGRGPGHQPAEAPVPWAGLAGTAGLTAGVVGWLGTAGRGRGSWRPRAGQAEADLDYGLADLGNIYAKCGLQGRQQLRRYVGQWHQPAAV
jgi:hypothetical protein